MPVKLKIMNFLIQSILAKSSSLIFTNPMIKVFIGEWKVVMSLRCAVAGFNIEVNRYKAKCLSVTCINQGTDE